MEQLTELDLEVLKSSMRRMLKELLAHKKITTASSYFGLWQDLRRIIEEELSSVANEECAAELEKIKNA